MVENLTGIKKLLSVTDDPDSLLDLASMKDLLNRMFREVDTDGNGYLTFDEFQELLHQMDLGTLVDHPHLPFANPLSCVVFLYMTIHCHDPHFIIIVVMMILFIIIIITIYPPPPPPPLPQVYPIVNYVP